MRYLNIFNSLVPSSSRVRFLGMILQNNLKWQAHINRLEDRCSNSMRTLKCLGKKWWGSDPLVLKRLYKALIRSRLEYGGFLLQDISPELTSKLDKLQLRALRVVME